MSAGSGVIVFLLALSCLLLALPGLLLGRFGPVAVRMLTLAALLLLFVAALDLERVEAGEEPARIALVATGDPAPAAVLAETLAAQDAEVELVAEAPWPERLAAAALRAGPRARELVLVWTGPLPEEEPVPAAGPMPAAGPVLAGHGITALAPDRRLHLEPDSLQTWLLGSREAGRPAALEVRLADAGRELGIEVEVRGPDGSELLRERVTVGPEVPLVELPLLPREPGEYAVVLRADVEGVQVQRRGSFSVAAARPVLVVGRQAGELAAALAVQGLEAQTRPGLPPDLEPWGVVVLLDAVAVPDQRRLLEYLDGGGGLFVVGGEAGALPAREEPLHEALPVVRLDRPPADAGEEDPTGQPVPEPPPPDTPPPETREEPPPPPDTPPRGEVGQARLDEIETEVERRVVAMVLVVDRSMSMGDRVEGGQLIKMDYAKRSALETASALQEGDEIGIVTFGNQGYGRTEMPLTSVLDLPAIQERISRLRHARESTYLTSGLKRAGDLLERSEAAVRFVVVITDGIISDSSLLVGSAAGKLAASGINVSLIQIAGNDNAVGVVKSKMVTDRGQGTYMLARSATQVPRLVVAEVGRALGRVGRDLPARPESPDRPAGEPPDREPPATEPPADPPAGDPPATDPVEAGPPEADPEAPIRLKVRAVTDSVLLEPRPPDGFPDLGGMDPVTGRFDAHVLLVGGDEGHPLLAFANRGLGRIAVWSSDLTGPWGEAWRRSPDFPGRLATWVQSLLPARPEAPDALLTGTTLDPVVPTPGELRRLRRLAGSEPLDLGAYRAPGPRPLHRPVGTGQELALAGVLAMVALALLEFLLLRWRSRLGEPTS